MKLSKSHVRIEAYGTVDELNAAISFLVNEIKNEPINQTLVSVQNRLFDLGSYLASDPEKKLIDLSLTDEDLEELEHGIDDMQDTLPKLRHFVLPGGTMLNSFAHLARTVCRRAERRVVALSTGDEVNPLVIKYLNRLSDYLFVLSRWISKESGIEEIKWHPRSND